MIAAIVLGCVVVAVGSGLFIFRDKIFKPKPPPQEEVKKKEPAKIALAPIKVNPIPTNISWSMDLKELAFPDSPAAGSIHGSGFALDRAILQGGNLTLRQGKSGPPELGLTVQFFAQQGEELAGKSVEITPDRAPPVPKVTLRFRDDQNQESRKPINSGYALRVTFSEVANGHLPGKIFICLPDENKSFVAGTFDAELKKPNPPKPKQPKQPKK
ncbi:MAG TPA: hypothetical protein VLT36_04505 [Candidatus Dormibacteraeota bacterium]|nr:hypothetical protein [Candidatus Dormibacteraeota bacterium]